MSDMEELVIVDTTDEISDLINSGGSHDIKPIINLHERQVKQNEKVNDWLNPQPKIVKKKVKNQLTYDNNPYGILVCSRFKVRSDIEEIPHSTEKRCHFSVEGNEINIKFPLRGEDADEMRKIGARKVIDFIMGLDRVPARLSELMSVPNTPVKRVNVTPADVVPFGPNTPRRRGQRGKSKLKSYTVRSELVKAKLTPITSAKDPQIGNKFKATTKLPGLGIEFIGVGTSRSLARLFSLTKALTYAKTHKLGGFGEREPSPVINDKLSLQEQTLYDHSEDSFDSIQYPAETEYYSEPQQNHIPVHSRLSPRIVTPVSNSTRYFEDTLFTHYPPTDRVRSPDIERAVYDHLGDEHITNAYYDPPHEIDYSSYPISSNFSPEVYYKPQPLPIGPQMYLRRGGWRGGARERGRGRGRRSRFMSKRGVNRFY